MHTITRQIQTKLLSILLFVILVTVLAACGGNKPEAKKIELLVSAAVSLTDPLEEIRTLYGKEHPEVTLTFNLGASGALRQQIEQGAVVDLFLSADHKNMKLLVEGEIVDVASQSVFTKNGLVVVVPVNSKSTPASIQNLLQKEYNHIALGEPETVPAGTYSKEALTTSNEWDSIQEKAVFGNNVRQVLSYVETNNADAGLVYKTDALTTDKVDIAFAINPSHHSPIDYYAGIIKNTKHAKEVQDFYQFLKEDEVQAIFATYGFFDIKQ